MLDPVHVRSDSGVHTGHTFRAAPFHSITGDSKEEEVVILFLHDGLNESSARVPGTGVVALPAACTDDGVVLLWGHLGHRHLADVYWDCTHVHFAQDRRFAAWNGERKGF